MLELMHLINSFVFNTMFFELLKYEMSWGRAEVITPAESVSEQLGGSNISIQWTIVFAL